MPKTPMNRRKALLICNEDEETLKELISLFLEDVPKHLEALKIGLQTKDAPAVLRSAHAITGSAANLSAGPLQTAANRLQTAAQNENLVQGSSLYEKIATEFLRLETFLKKPPPRTR